MLKGLFYIFLGIMLACSCNSKSKKQNEQEVNTPTSVNDSNTIAKIEFPQKSFNFGDLQEGEIVTHTFRFKNTGTKSLVILNVEAVVAALTPSMTKNRSRREEKEKSKLNLTLRADMVNNTK